MEHYGVLPMVRSQHYRHLFPSTLAVALKTFLIWLLLASTITRCLLVHYLLSTNGGRILAGKDSFFWSVATASAFPSIYNWDVGPACPLLVGLIVANALVLHSCIQDLQMIKDTSKHATGIDWNTYTFFPILSRHIRDPGLQQKAASFHLTRRRTAWAAKWPQ
ncbi:uncharacterized protein EI90DRAFT_2473142 [Cantharellus anzutake]|uniref:uncharacterized protein n=1 Tax=Cantharellus anzutake TaxID=1750568 RepID=UPI001908F2D5|nr:uncharacterized protein EI90DRAFT_2473142 [Cantharellus anzutake]KAF8322752.1 hypothetical protein EI90DRAFT_2473142 [Cantharellus anzutake]